MVASEMFVSTQRRNGTRKRDVCSAESASVEPTKMKPSQIKTGSQYLRKDFIVGTEEIGAMFMERMWGGRRLESEFAKKLPDKVRIGESWEIVDRLEAQSVVRSGPLKGNTLDELWTQHRRAIFGDVPDTERFPLLIKLLDANEKL